MRDFLDLLASTAKATIKEGYYRVQGVKHTPMSLTEAILNCRGNPVIAEVKPSSPSRRLLGDEVSIIKIALEMQRGGAVGISILTEPKHFSGSLEAFKRIRETTSLPLLMKDFILDQVQIDAASKIGGDAILLIQALFDRGYCSLPRDEMIARAHAEGLEVLLEAHSKGEFRKAVQSEADLIGINNRDLSTLNVNIETTRKVLQSTPAEKKVVISESGVETPQQVLLTRKWGARACLVGTAVMTAPSVEEKVRELTGA